MVFRSDLIYMVYRKARSKKFELYQLTAIERCNIMSDNNSGYIKILQAEVLAAKAEIEAIKAESEAAKTEARAVKAEAEAVKAEAEALMAEAEALKAEAEALMAEAEVAKAEAELEATTVVDKTVISKLPSDQVAVNQTYEKKREPLIPPDAIQIVGAVSIAAMEEGEKLPKERVVLYPEEYQKIGITNFRATVFKDYDYEGYSMLAINGEYDGRTSDYLIIMPMVYNAAGDLIGADFDEKIQQKIRSHKTYSLSLKVPNNEQISKVEVRIIKDPVSLD